MDTYKDQDDTGSAHNLAGRNRQWRRHAGERQHFVKSGSYSVSSLENRDLRTRTVVWIPHHINQKVAFVGDDSRKYVAAVTSNQVTQMRLY